MDDMPTRSQIATWLTSNGHPDAWADSLTGLPWRYIHPVVTIAANTGNHPLVALGAAAAYSRDPDFRAAAAKHAGHPTPPPAASPGPNRAQRRAAAKQGRKSR